MDSGIVAFALLACGGRGSHWRTENIGFLVIQSMRLSVLNSHLR